MTVVTDGGVTILWVSKYRADMISASGFPRKRNGTKQSNRLTASLVFPRSAQPHRSLLLQGRRPFIKATSLWRIDVRGHSNEFQSPLLHPKIRSPEPATKAQCLSAIRHLFLRRFRVFRRLFSSSMFLIN